MSIIIRFLLSIKFGKDQNIFLRRSIGTSTCTNSKDIIANVKTRKEILNTRILLHRTSVCIADKIIKEGIIKSYNDSVSFSVIPNELNQSSYGGTILVFQWNGKIHQENEIVQHSLCHTFSYSRSDSQDYIESFIKKPYYGNQLSIIAIILPDIINNKINPELYLLQNPIIIKVL